MENTKKLARVRFSWRPIEPVVKTFHHEKENFSTINLLLYCQLLDNGMVYFEYQNREHRAPHSDTISISEFQDFWNIDMQKLINTAKR